MLNTYINDRNLDEYPFYNLGDVPFPPGFIKYLGVCLLAQGASRVFASAISVSADGVLVSICRDKNDGSSGTETIGSIYAPASSGTANIAIEGGTISGSMSMLIDKSLLKNAYGNYNGKFYLDPSCVTYMPANVYGKLKMLEINGTTYQADQAVDFSCMGGVITMQNPTISADGSSRTATITGSSDVNNFTLVAAAPRNEIVVEGINTLAITADTAEATTAAPYPAIAFLIDGTAISFNVLKGSMQEPADLVVEIVGDTSFPNCYATGDEAHADINQ